MSQRVAILISGGGSNMVRLVESLAGSSLGEAALVLSNIPEAGGLEKARALGVSTQTIDHRSFDQDRAAFEAALVQALIDAEIDLICLAGFMRILGAGFVSQFEGKILNIHPSLLPEYKGLHTHARALEAGDQEAGCSVHEVTTALDDGPILGQARVPVLADDTPKSLAARVLVAEHKLYPAVLENVLRGDRTPLLM